jgi:hypothetical protein
MRTITLGLALAATLFIGISTTQAGPPAKVQRLPQIGGTAGVPIYGASGYGGYGYGVPSYGYGASSYVSPYGLGYGSSSYYRSPYGYGSYNNSGVVPTPFGYGYYRNSNVQLAPGLGYRSGVSVTPWGIQSYGYGY